MIAVSLMLILVAMVLLGSGLVRGSNSLLVSAFAASLLAAIALVIGARQVAPAQLGLPWPRRARRDRVAATSTVTPGAAAAATGDAPTPRTGARRGAPVSPAPASPAGPHAAGAAPVTSSPPVPEEPAPPPAATAPTDEAAPAGTAHPDEAAPVGAAHPDEAAPQPAGTAPPPAAGTGTTGSRAAPAEPDTPEPEAAGRSEQPAEDFGEIPPDEPAAQVVSPADRARVAALSDPVRVIDGRPRYHVADCVHLLGRESEELPVGEALSLGFTPCGLCEPDLVLLDRARQG